MNRNQKLDLTQKATNLGIKAFVSNKNSTPINDQELMSLINKSRTIIGNEVGSSLFIFQAWSAAWHKSNMIVLNQ